MSMEPAEVQARLEHILPRVQKPGRYTGGELNQIVKEWDATSTRVALAFPDIYDLGMSNLGLAILYDALNQQDGVLAERVYLPWPDMEAQMHATGLPLYSLETKHPVAAFDILGISLPYETLYTNTLNLLDLAGIPIRSADRASSHPLVIAGGHAAFNPEPMAEFIDAFVIGEGEEVILDIVRAFQAWRERGEDRASLLRSLARIWGVYVPSLYRVEYHQNGTIRKVKPLVEEAAMPVLKRIVGRLPPPITRFIVPFVDVTHNRIPIEITRGCTRGCRFCQAGMITRPVRERSLTEIMRAIEEAVQVTGLDEVGLLSLSSSDHDEIIPLVQEASRKFSDQHIRVSLPSLRIESVSVELMDQLMGQASRSGFTLAPEAATRDLSPRLAHYQALLHDRPPPRDAERCPGHR